MLFRSVSQSRYWFVSVDHEYLALEDGPPMFRQGFTCPALLVPHLVPPPTFSIRDYHPLWSAFPCRSDKSMAILRRLFRFRSPLLSESRLMSIPQGTEMFQFPWFASHTYVFSMRYPCGWVSPFGNLRIKAHLPAPRSLSQAITSLYRDWETDRKSTRLNSSHLKLSRMPSSA